MFTINLDIGEVVKLSDELGGAATEAMKKAGDALTKMTEAHIKEQASKKLHSRRQLFIDSLSTQQVGDDTWLVVLNAKAVWIDEGMPAHNMLDDLLRSKKAKRAKDGSTYVVVPFNHGPGKGPASTTPAQQDLIGTIKSEMKRRGIPFGGIEKDASGADKLGKLHSFDVTKLPKKVTEGPGQGHGPVGEVRQGPTGIPFLQGVSVYQKKGADGKTKKSIMTFRVASSKHRGQGRWDHPGLEAMNFMEDAVKWAQEQWDKEIAPQVLDWVLAKL